jgi:hypothetical protein
MTNPHFNTQRAEMGSESSAGLNVGFMIEYEPAILALYPDPIYPDISNRTHESWQKAKAAVVGWPNISTTSM